MPEKNQLYIREFLLHAFYLALIVLCLWFWTNNPVLVNYNLQLTAVLILAYFLIRLIIHKVLNYILDIIMFTAILLLILSSTGGLNSSFFFLIYFLLFAVALLFDPPITLTLTLSLIIFFANTLNSLHSALQLISLILITPLAIFLGKQYLRLLESNEKIKILSKKAKLLRLQGDALEASVRNEETNSLLWLCLDFKNGLLKITHQASELLADIGRLSWTQKEKLQSIHETAKGLLKSGEKLKEKIDRETD